MLTLTPTESLEIRRSDPELLEVEATYKSARRPPPKHLHPVQDEHFEVLEGSIQVKIGADQRRFEQGHTFDIPRDTAHTMWNPTERQARLRWETRPAGRTEEWFRAIDRLHREGRVGGNGMPGPLWFGVMLSEYDDTFRLAIPRVLALPAVRFTAAIGRLRGYQPGTD